MSLIPINVVTEDELSAAFAVRLLKNVGKGFYPSHVYSNGGNGKIQKQIKSFNLAAEFCPYLIFTDLDARPCPVAYRNELMAGYVQSPNLLLRIPVREIEAWIMADREGFADFLNVSKDLMPLNLDKVEDPKRKLFEIVGRSNLRRLKESIMPDPGGTAKVGPDYNGKLIYFLQSRWSLEAAERHSESLRRTVASIKVWKKSKRL